MSVVLDGATGCTGRLGTAEHVRFAVAALDPAGFLRAMAPHGVSYELGPPAAA